MSVQSYDSLSPSVSRELLDPDARTREKKKKLCLHCDVQHCRSAYYLHKRMYYSEKTGIWERKDTPSSLSRCEQLPTNDDELGDNECVNLDDDEPFVVNDLTDSDQETSKLDSDIDDHMNEVRFVYNIIIEFF